MPLGRVISSSAAYSCDARATSDDEPFLREMLYAALYVPAGADPFPRSVLAEPAIAAYVQGFGRPGDVGVVADDEHGRPIGGASVRRFTAARPATGSSMPPRRS